MTKRQAYLEMYKRAYDNFYNLYETLKMPGHYDEAQALARICIDSFRDMDKAYNEYQESEEA